jgi:hypothetical protein
MDQEPDNNQADKSASLESQETVAGQSQLPAEDKPLSEISQGVAATPGQSVEQLSPQPKKSPIKDKLAKLRKSINIYLLMFALVVILAIIVAFVAYQKSQESLPENLSGSSSQKINEEVLDQLRNSDVSIGEPNQILGVEANAVFAGTVLVRGDFEAAGQIKSGGPISASNLNISDTGTFQTLQASSFQLAGDGEIQGSFNVQNNLSVSGSGNFGGTLSAGKLNIQSLELGGNLVISKHISTSGGNPSKSNGSALGGGGTSSVSGSDTAGTININTGNSPPAGCFITVNFTQRFDSTPHVVVTPVGSRGASLNYYVNRSASSFSLCTSSGAPAGKNFSFDYIVID